MLLFFLYMIMISCKLSYHDDIDTTKPFCNIHTDHETPKTPKTQRRTPKTIVYSVYICQNTSGL